MPGLMPTSRTRTPGWIRSRSGGSTAGKIRGMAQWLVKEEPEHYSYDQLERDRKTVWAGVRNPLAQKHLRSIRRGDRIFYYHTGKEKVFFSMARAARSASLFPYAPLARLYGGDVGRDEPLGRP